MKNDKSLELGTILFLIFLVLKGINNKIDINTVIEELIEKHK